MPVTMGEWSGSDATDRLRETIIELNNTEQRQTRQLVRLTRALVWLTIALVVGLVVQVGIALDWIHS